MVQRLDKVTVCDLRKASRENKMKIRELMFACRTDKYGAYIISTEVEKKTEIDDNTCKIYIYVQRRAALVTRCQRNASIVIPALRYCHRFSNNRPFPLHRALQPPGPH